MGSTKQLAELNGKPMVLWVRDAALSHMDEVIIVTGHEAEQVEELVRHPRVKVIYNKHYQKGQGSSLQAGLAGVHHLTKSVLVMLADQPFLPPPIIDRILEGGRKQLEEGKKPFAIRPVYKGVPGHPVFLGNVHAVKSFPLSEDAGGRRMLKQLPVIEYEVNEAMVTFDIDTPDHLNRARNFISKFDFSYNLYDMGAGSLTGTVKS